MMQFLSAPLTRIFLHSYVQTFRQFWSVEIVALILYTYIKVVLYFHGHAKTVTLFFRVASICNLLDATLNRRKTRWVTLFQFSPFHKIMYPQIFARFRPFFKYKKNRRLQNRSHFTTVYLLLNKAFYCYSDCFLFDYCYSDYSYSHCPLLHKPWPGTAGAVQVILSCQLW